MNIHYTLRSIANSVLFVAVFIGEVSAQDTTYARQIIRTLTHPDFAGRGYVNDGSNRAADYIARQFHQDELAKFGEDYFQEFTLDINTFPDEVEIKLDNDALQPGLDFIVEPCACKIDGDYDLVYFPSAIFSSDQKILSFLKKQKKLNKQVLIVDKTTLPVEEKESRDRYQRLINTIKAHPNAPVAILELTLEKLTWSASQQQCKSPVITVRKDSLHNSISFEEADLEIESKWEKDYEVKNVIGYVEGSAYPDKYIVFSAHYDHLGRMGSEALFPGANDNASGTALLLDLAKYFSDPAHRPSYSVVFIAFAGEEVGLLGSEHYVNNPLFNLDAIRFLINVDIMGTGDEGITIVNGVEETEAVALLNDINDRNQLLESIKTRKNRPISDHYFFAERGVPAIFIYTRGGVSYYHDVLDRSETLPLTEYGDIHRLITTFISELK